MPESLIYILVLLSLFILELAYFRLADRFNIIDKPNHRSSHSRITIRGGGIIFPIAVLSWFIYIDFDFPFFVLGLFIIALISFIDDVSTLKSGIRSMVHLFAVALVLYQLNIDAEWYFLALILFLVVGTINAYNFMDGINGITGAYSLILLLSLWYCNNYVVNFTSESLLIFVLLSVLVFNFFNFRRVAKCFAGDVGSVSIALIICFLLVQMIAATGNLMFVAFLLVYGLDAVTTVIFRLIRGENIAEAHRSHFYQYLANERKWPHLRVAVLYAVLQLSINAIVLFFYEGDSGADLDIRPLAAVLFVTGLGFIGLRVIVEGRERLFKRAVEV